MPLELYPFRLLDHVTKKWVRARYVAELHVIAERYTKWEITGPPDIRSGAPVVMFSPSAALKPLAISARGHLPPVEDPPPDHGPTPDPQPVEQPPPIEDQLERFLVLMFLRRYLKISSPELALKRIAARVRQGGHDVPRVDVVRRFSRSWINFVQVYQPLADVWSVYDNSGETPRLLEQRS